MIPFFEKSKEFIGHAGQIFSLAFDGNYIYSAASDKFVTRWDLTSETQDKFAIRFEKSPYSICLIENQSKLVVGLENGDLHIFDLSLKKEIKFYQQHRSAIFYALENKLKNEFYTSDADGNIAVWDSLTLNLKVFLPFACGKIRRLRLNHDGSKLFLACQDGTIRIIETEFYNQIDEFFAHHDGATCVSVKENQILTGGKDAHLKLWDLDSKKCLKSIPAHNFVIYDIEFLNENVFVSISRDKSIKIWDANELSVIQKIDAKSRGHKHSVNSIMKISDSSFATCSDDRSIKLFRRIQSL
jgi:WD40 repeat protein